MKQRDLSHVCTDAIPLFLASAWHDICIQDALEDFQSCTHANLEILTGCHLEYVSKLDRLLASTLKFFRAQEASERSASLNQIIFDIYSGPQRVGSLSWPPASVRPTKMFFQSMNCLDSNMSEAIEYTFVYRPSHPTPCRGGTGLGKLASGRKDQQVVERRTDVLVFTSAPVQCDLDLQGSCLFTIFLPARRNNSSPYCASSNASGTALIGRSPSLAEDASLSNARSRSRLRCGP